MAETSFLRTVFPLGVMGSVGVLMLISHTQSSGRDGRGVCVDRGTKAGTSNRKDSVFLDFVDKKICLRPCNPSFTQGHSRPMWRLCSLLDLLCLIGAASSSVLLLAGSCSLSCSWCSLPRAKADGCKANTGDALVPCRMRCVGIVVRDV